MSQEFSVFHSILSLKIISLSDFQTRVLVSGQALYSLYFYLFFYFYSFFLKCLLLLDPSHSQSLTPSHLQYNFAI